VGQVRQVNQDHVIVADQVFVVADGMGGHRGGEVASEVAAQSFIEHFTEPTPSELRNAVQAANHDVVVQASTDPDLRGMGTTVVALAAVTDDAGPHLSIVNVGDSRAYLLPAGTSELRQITEDHSLVQTLVRQGQLTPADAAVHPQRNIVTRALGIDDRVLIDSFDVLAVAGDRYLLCSDGLFNEVPESRLATVLRQYTDPQAAADELVRLANDHGGRDNITVVVVDVLDADPAPGLQPVDGDDRLVRTVYGNDEVGREPQLPTAPVPITAVPHADAASNSPTSDSPADSWASASPSTELGDTTADADHDQDDDDNDGNEDHETTGAASATAGTRTDPAGPKAGLGDAPAADTRSRAERKADAKAERLVDPTAPRTRFTWRVLAFVAAALGIVAVTFVAIDNYANNNYFVGFDGEQVAIWQGHPGGVLWYQPELVESTGVTREQLRPESIDQVTGQRAFGSQADARQFVVNVTLPPTTTTTTTSTTTSTTAPTDPAATDDPAIDPAIDPGADPGSPAATPAPGTPTP
jgi:serine/threonine protein phosphatase PrpC